MGCSVLIIRGVIDGDRPARYDLGSQLGIRREHTMKPYEVESGPWYEGGQALHELQRGHNDVGGTVPIGAFQLQHDITSAVEFEPVIGDGGTGDIAAQLFELVALTSGAAHRGVEAEALLVSTALWRILRFKAGDGLQAQHLMTRAGSECNTVGAGGRLQRRHGIIGIIRFGHVSHPLLFNQIAQACQQLHGSLYDLVEQWVQLFGGGCTCRLEYWTLVGHAIDPIQKNTMQMYV